ncbi:MAG: hypothetical protein Kow0042_16680 [Calditrichia bacterium]
MEKLLHPQPIHPHPNRQNQKYILLVDNYTGKLGGFFKHLLRRGYPVVIVGSEKEAVRFVTRHKVKLVISQIALLDSDITRFEQNLRKMAYGGPIVPVVDDSLTERVIQSLNLPISYKITNTMDHSSNERLVQSLIQHSENKPRGDVSASGWQELYSITIPSMSKHIERVTSFVIGKISPFAPTNFCFSGLRMALSEALANAIEHGNAFDPHMKVAINLAVNHEMLIISVKDEGVGFPYQKLEDNLSRLNKQFCGRGRGLLFIKKFMDHVRFIPPGNTIVLIKYF